MRACPLRRNVRSGHRCQRRQEQKAPAGEESFPFSSVHFSALPGGGASSSHCTRGLPGTYTTRTRDLTPSWSVSTEPSSRRCPAKKAMPSPTWTARSQQTERGGRGRSGAGHLHQTGGRGLLELISCKPLLEEGSCPGGALSALSPP